MDTNKFKKKNKVRKLVKLINPDYKTIVLISRIDDGKEIPMFQLMKILPDLVDRLKGLNILVVGSGKKLPELEKLSNSITPPLKNLNLNFVGEVTNVPDYLSLADLVLACDRAAIEGILCEKIVFYMGLGKWKSLISDDNFEELLFTPGGFAEYSDVELANHLTWMLTQQELVKEKTKMLSDKLREICAVEYITDQLLSVYKKKR
jgi:glycosyltransferase involved in cell wall biosynthesis